MKEQNSLTIMMRSGKIFTRKEQLRMVVRFSMPAILAEMSSIAMQYIDAAMVGSLGAGATAAIGLVVSSTWLVGGLCVGTATGFSVQAAQLIGAGRDAEARDVFRQALITLILFSLMMTGIGIAVSGGLPVWLGGDKEIVGDASRYFFIYCCALPAAQLRQLCGGMLQCSGDMKTPSILNTMMCGLDVIFNRMLIFPTGSFRLFGISVSLYGAGLGVSGAALGTALAEFATAVIMIWAACVRSPKLRLTEKGSWKLKKRCLQTAARIAIPMSVEHTVMCGAQVFSTKIVAPLGTVSVAAHSLAITAESLCYMPGYGIGAAATTLVGQSIGAGREDLARRFSRLSVFLGMAVMAAAGALMYLFAPPLFVMLTSDAAVQSLGADMLRIEAFAEPFYAASIVAAGALRGAGDTMVPGIINLASIWMIRMSAAALLAPRIGLTGVWLAMCGELCIRGVLFLLRLFREKWLKKGLAAA